MIIHVDIAPGVPLQVYGDQFKLEHVLGNLLSNAIKFSDAGRRIWISVDRDGDATTVLFSVRDEGAGMNETLCRSLFDLFLHDDEKSVVQSGYKFGIGLFICKSIVALSGGSITCRSKQRQEGDISTGYTEFSFTIGDNDGTSDAAAAPLPTSGSISSISSLLSDDIPEDELCATLSSDNKVLRSLQLDRSDASQAYEVRIAAREPNGPTDDSHSMLASKPTVVIDNYSTRALASLPSTPSVADHCDTGAKVSSKNILIVDGESV